MKTGNEAQLIVRSVPSVSVVSVAIAERSLIYFARVAGQGLRSISIAGRRKSKGQLRSPHTHGPAHGCKSVGACAYGEMLRQQSWIHRSRTNRSRTVVLERRSDTCSCGWKLLILTGVIIMWHHGVTREAHKVATHGCFLRLSWVQSTLTWHRMVQSPRFGVCAVLAATWAGRGLCKKYCSGSELAPFFDMFGTAGPIFAN